MEGLITSSLSSSLSSADDKGAATAPAGEAVEPGHILDLLQRSRADGGYGGHVSFSEYAYLARAVGWSTEEQEDAWYELVQGVPVAETTRVELLAELLAFSGASPRVLARLPPPAGANTVAVSSRTDDIPAATQHGTSLQTSHTNEQRAHGGGARQHEEGQTAVPPRYASPTVTSAYRRAHTDLLHSVLADATTQPAHQRRQPRCPPGAAGAEAGARASVFDRLYPARNTKAAASPRANRTPSPVRPPRSTATSRGTSPPPPNARASPSARALTRGTGSTYSKPTQSYYAKLVGAEGASHHDPIADAPETPRVAYHPAPGPSGCVPPGYVEGVARRRQQTAARFYGRDFEDTLRRPSFRTEAADPHSHDTTWLYSAPILRLPLSAEEGGRGSVDVRLTPATTRSSAERAGASGYCAIHLGLRERQGGLPDPLASQGNQRGRSPSLRGRRSPHGKAVVGGKRHTDSGEHFKAHSTSCP